MTPTSSPLHEAVDHLERQRAERAEWQRAEWPCEHPLVRTVTRGPTVYCWACRRWLSKPEAWLVIERWNALAGPSLLDLFRTDTEEAKP